MINVSYLIYNIKHHLMKILGKVIQSQSDKRAFRAIELKNRLQCLIISDAEAQKSSAALSIGVGSLKDPLQAQGLAHYLEHMLFMGTEKYPDENDYSNVCLHLHSLSPKTQDTPTPTLLKNKPISILKFPPMHSHKHWTDSLNFLLPHSCLIHPLKGSSTLSIRSTQKTFKTMGGENINFPSI